MIFECQVHYFSMSSYNIKNKKYKNKLCCCYKTRVLGLFTQGYVYLQYTIYPDVSGTPQVPILNEFINTITIQTIMKFYRIIKISNFFI